MLILHLITFKHFLEEPIPRYYKEPSLMFLVDISIFNNNFTIQDDVPVLLDLNVFAPGNSKKLHGPIKRRISDDQRY